MKAPHGFDQVVATYGDIRHWIRTDGTIQPKWETSTMVSLPLPAPLPLAWDHGRLALSARCHQVVAPELRAVLIELHRLGLWLGEARAAEGVREYGGCYAFRTQRGSASKLSLHAFGAAIDLNTTTNRLGEVGDMSPAVVEVFESRGWTWGGRFSRPDPMHFQFASGY